MATTSTKPALSALKTPLSATYPSELRSPMVAGSPTWLKRERVDDDLKTPITPPTAYVDFLKALSPALMSPLATGSSTKFTFPERSSSSSTISSFNSSGPTSAPIQTADVQPPSSPTNASDASSRSSSSCSCDRPSPEKKADDKKAGDKPKQITIPPHSPSFSPPLSARSLRRLQIPQSPYSPGGIRSPMSARSIQSPYGAILSPREGDDRSKSSGTSRAVVVRQVVTRTVTYSRTPVDAAPPAPLDPAPKGKRRRIE